ncbi:MAG: T9SS type A sorting domain-containing protein [Bacteroidota bacterium]
MASLKVYTVLGQEVATLFNGAAEAGRVYRTTWDASGMPSGMYFARLESAGKAGMKRLMLVK